MKTSLQIRQAKLAAKDVLFEYRGNEQWVALEREVSVGLMANIFEPVFLFECGCFAVMSQLQAAYLAGGTDIPAYQRGSVRQHLVAVCGYTLEDGWLKAPRWRVETREQRIARMVAEHAINEQRAVELPVHDIQRATRLAKYLHTPRPALHRERWSITGSRKAAFWALVAVLVK